MFKIMSPIQVLPCVHRSKDTGHERSCDNVDMSGSSFLQHRPWSQQMDQS